MWFCLSGSFQDIAACRESQKCKELCDDYAMRLGWHGRMLRIAEQMVKVSTSEDLETSFSAFKNIRVAVEALTKDLQEGAKPISDALVPFHEKFSLAEQAKPLVQQHLASLKDQLMRINLIVFLACAYGIVFCFGHQSRTCLRRASRCMRVRN